jgi:hypothetical protein
LEFALGLGFVCPRGRSKVRRCHDNLCPAVVPAALLLRTLYLPWWHLTPIDGCFQWEHEFGDTCHPRTLEIKYVCMCPASREIQITAGAGAGESYVIRLCSWQEASEKELTNTVIIGPVMEKGRVAWYCSWGVRSSTASIKTALLSCISPMRSGL